VVGREASEDGWSVHYIVTHTGAELAERLAGMVLLRRADQAGPQQLREAGFAPSLIAASFAQLIAG